MYVDLGTSIYLTNERAGAEAAFSIDANIRRSIEHIREYICKCRWTFVFSQQLSQARSTYERTMRTTYTGWLYVLVRTTISKQAGRVANPPIVQYTACSSCTAWRSCTTSTVFPSLGKNIQFPSPLPVSPPPFMYAIASKLQTEIICFHCTLPWCKVTHLLILPVSIWPIPVQ